MAIQNEMTHVRTVQADLRKSIRGLKINDLKKDKSISELEAAVHSLESKVRFLTFMIFIHAVIVGVILIYLWG